MQIKTYFSMYIVAVWIIYELVSPGLNRFVALAVSMFAAYWLSLPLVLYYKARNRKI